MKKIYKLTLGAGAAATAAIPAIAVVSCGSTSSKKTESNTNSNTNTESKGTTGTHTSTVPQTHRLNHVALSAAQMDTQFATAKSDLLKRFIELKIADASTTDADFDKNFGDYAVKSLKVIATDENALSATDTANLIEVIISKYSKDISADILPEIVKQVPVIAKYISDNHLLKGALDALDFDKDSEDADLLEKLDSNNLNLVKAALFVAKAVQSIPKDLTADTAESVITMIQTLGLPGMIKELFPNTQEAMAAWAGLLNSGIIQQVGQLIDAIFTKGIGNIDFDVVKKDLEDLIDNAVKTMNEAQASIAAFTGNNIKGLVDKLHIPALIDILKSIVTEGVFGIDTKITDEIKAVYDSHILALLGQLLPMDQYTQLINTFTGIINTVVNPNGGVASLSEANFDSTLKSIMGLIPGASLSDDIKGLITKVLYHGWATKQEFIDAIYSILPDSVTKMAPIDAKITTIDVNNEIIKPLLSVFYDGKKYEGMGPVGLAIGVIPETVTQPFHTLLTKGLFNLSKEDVENLFVALQGVSNQVKSILGGLIGGIAVSQLPDSVKPIVNEIKPILSEVSTISKDHLTLAGDGIYELLHSGIASSATSLRATVQFVFEEINKLKISIPAYVQPLVMAAINGLDSITVEQGRTLADWISTFIPAGTPVVSSEAFKTVIYTALVGQHAIDADAKAKADAAAHAALVVSENAKITSFVAQALSGTVSPETLAKTSDQVLASEIILPQAPEGLNVVIKSTRFAGDKVVVTYTVSSSVDGTKTMDYTSEISGFQATHKLTVESFLTELIARFNKESTTLITSNNVKAKEIFVSYLTEIGIANAQSMRDAVAYKGLFAASKGLIYSTEIFRYSSFTEWMNSKVASKEATASDSVKAFVAAMDALNA